MQVAGHQLQMTTHEDVHVIEVGDGTSLILFKTRVNDQPATALFNTGASMTVISTRFFDSLKHKPKILKCNRTLRGAGDEAFIHKVESFLQIKIGKQMFRDRVVIVNNLNHNYIIGTAIQRSYHIATGFRITGMHFWSVNGQIVAQSIHAPTIEPIIKSKGKIKLSPHSITAVSIKTPPNVNTSHIYERNYKFSYQVV